MTASTTSLAEDFLLLAYDDETGKSRVEATTRLPASLAAAALLDLTLAGSLEVTGDHPKPEKRRLRRTGVAAHDPLLAEIAEHADGKKVKDAVMSIAGVTSFKSRAESLRKAVLERLVSHGVLRETKASVLGIPTGTRYPETDGDYESRLIDGIRRAMESDAEIEPRMAALISLAGAADLLPGLLSDLDSEWVESRGRQIADGGWAGPAVQASVDTVYAVLWTAIMVPIIGGATGGAGY